MKKVLKIILFFSLVSQNVTYLHAMSQARDTFARFGQNPNVRAMTAWAKEKKEHAKRLWVCFNNPTQCSPAEASAARKWVIGAPVTAILAILALVGIKYKLQTARAMKQRAQAGQESAGAEGIQGIEQQNIEQLEQSPAIQSLKLALKSFEAFMNTIELGSGKTIYDQMSSQQQDALKNLLQGSLTNIYTNAVNQPIQGVVDDINSGTFPQALQQACDHFSGDLKTRFCDYASKAFTLEKVYKELSARQLGSTFRSLLQK